MRKMHAKALIVNKPMLNPSLNLSLNPSLNPSQSPSRGRSKTDKWTKTELLQGDPELKKHLPPAQMLTESGLREMLQQCGMVYVKPIRGSQGRGVMKVEMIEAKAAGRPVRIYAYQLGEKKRAFPVYKSFYRSMLNNAQGKVYLVQKGIQLLKHKGRPFDIRLVVQRAPRGGWKATATVGRVAHPRKIVTNGSQGGTIYPTAYLLRSYTNETGRLRLLKQMDQLGVRTAQRLSLVYPGIVELGLDIALDQQLKPWILEVNNRPDHCPFTLLEDQSMLRRIIRYGKANGKIYRLRCKKAKRGL
ncbi:YheC/YheD family protein [Paenibacillus sp. Soil522]|uniref:YheC/YheD family protein n=1 Tax=Paenibacillus sp. Soil522 TaxID=1736388 RepID=UPI001F2C5FCA|nr:YheC/YheD family protein [Paenibacillus sp. Soil522]